MPIGGKLMLKGGVSLKGTKKKKKKKHAKAEDPEGEAGAEGQQQELAEGGAGASGEPGAPSTQPPKAKPQAISVSGKTYEEEFDLEIARAKSAKVSNTPWGSSYKAPPKILHGYSKPVKGVNASERLDLRAASKTDKFCK